MLLNLIVIRQPELIAESATEEAFQKLLIKDYNSEAPKMKMNPKLQQKVADPKQ